MVTKRHALTPDEKQIPVNLPSKSLTDTVINIFGPVEARGKTDTIQYCSTACHYLQIITTVRN
jgi:hypothetical protein